MTFEYDSGDDKCWLWVAAVAVDGVVGDDCVSD